MNIAVEELFSSVEKADGFKVCHINAESLINEAHFSEFLVLFSKNTFDAIAVSETFLKPKVKNTLMKVPGYNVFRADRTSRNGGGVAVYFKDCYKCEVLAASVDNEGN